MKVVVTGSTGLVGTALCRALRARGDEVVRLTRRAPSKPDEKRWDPKGGTVDEGALDGADAVVHLAGAPVAERWTESHKRMILESRELGTKTIANAVAACESPPALLSASAIGFYGPRGDEELREDSTPGDDFLADVCERWEAATAPAKAAGGRVVCMRIGLVLSKDGGALSKMLPAFKMGVGGKLGDGAQYMSWVHIDDLVAMILCAIDEPKYEGVFNAVGPNPVTNAEFTDALGSALRRPTFFAVPKFALKLAAGQMSEAVLQSARVLPAQLEEWGFEFKHPDLGPALRSML